MVNANSKNKTPTPTSSTTKESKEKYNYRKFFLYLIIPILISSLVMFVFKNGRFFTTSPTTTISGFKVVGHCISKEFSTPISGEGHRCGEDAWRIAKVNNPNGQSKYLFSVADGVGGWRENGGDSSIVSNSLLDSIKNEFLTSNNASLLELSEKAFNSLIRKGGLLKGSTTLTLLSFQDQKVSVLNLGDSGALIIRPSDKEIIFRTKPGQQGFNTPHQIGFGHLGEPQGSIRNQATIHTLPIPLLKGDIILLGTDGLFDNLYDADILEYLTRHDYSVEKLANLAYVKSLDTRWLSPFALSTGGRYMGGKNDDISLILAKAI